MNDLIAACNRRQAALHGGGGGGEGGAGLGDGPHNSTRYTPDTPLPPRSTVDEEQPTPVPVNQNPTPSGAPIFAAHAISSAVVLQDSTPINSPIKGVSHAAAAKCAGGVVVEPLTAVESSAENLVASFGASSLPTPPLLSLAASSTFVPVPPPPATDHAPHTAGATPPSPVATPSSSPQRDPDTPAAKSSSSMLHKVPSTLQTVGKSVASQRTQYNVSLVRRQMENSILGRGAFGTVFLGLHSLTGEYVAVKELTFASRPNSPNANAELAKQIKGAVQEIGLMRRLRHTNVVQYLGGERNGTTLYIFMEYIAGGTLAEVVQRFGRLPEATARAFMKQVLTGLAFLHGEGVVHRDVKGENIMITAKGVVKLADFGCSKPLSSCLEESADKGGRAGTLVGTPWYMAPEVIQGAHCTAAVDIWSAGCVLLHLLQGERPYSDVKDPHAALFRIACDSRPPVLPPHGLSPECRQFFSRCLVRDAPQRATAMELLQHPWMREDFAPPTTPIADEHLTHVVRSDAPPPPVEGMFESSLGSCDIMDILNGRPDAAAASSPPSPPSHSDAGVLQQLEQLHRRGLLTDMELEAKKHLLSTQQHHHA